MRELQRDMGLSMIFIAHDLSMIKYISDLTMEMYLGRHMEQAAAIELVRMPRQPYPQALIASVLIPDPKLEKARHRPVLQGELPPPLAPPTGCVYRTRCPKGTDCLYARKTDTFRKS
ncbi:MAG: oligopeptide/dipeptide ABC transporter ATP-binding protein [Paracoccaceae bacterium]